jgi:DNA polymerase III epsilon subunit family exonuclease
MVAVEAILASPLADAAFAVLDFETTGLDVSRGARVVEVAALRLSRGAVTDHFLTLVHPGVPIPADATAVHGITDADVAGQPPLEDVFPRLAAFLADAVFAAYNLKFDYSFLAAGARETGTDALPAATVDVLGLARRFTPGLDRYDLETVARAWGLDNPTAHRALGDAAVTAELLLLFLGRAREAGATTVAELVVLSRGVTVPDVHADVILALERAAAAGEDVAVVYAGAVGERTRRIVPTRLSYKGGVGYCAAFCREAQARREFRLDRLKLAAADAGAP